MTVEIVLAAFNGETYLAAQIDSILAQDYKDWKLLIRDDGSTDGTVKIIEQYAEKYPDRIQLLKTELGEKKHLGLIGNFSALLTATTAPYVMCCDQDDVWLPHKISLTLSGMRELEAEAGTEIPLVIHTDSVITDANLQVLHNSFGAFNQLAADNSPLPRLLVQNTVQGCTMMVNRALLTLALPLPPVIRMHDMWMALVAASMGQIGYIDQVTVQYRQHGKNAVGARKKTIRERVQHIQTMMEGNVTQAVLFLDRFKDKLSKENLTLITVFSKMPDHGFMKRRRVLTENKIARLPKWQNFVMMLFV